jgi:hypothetical protein
VKEGLKQVFRQQAILPHRRWKPRVQKILSAGRRTDPDRFVHGPMRQPAAEAAGEIQLVIDQARHSVDTSLDQSDDPHGPVIQMRHGQQFHAVALVSDGDALQRHLGAAAAEPAEPGFVSNRLDVGCQAAPRHGSVAVGGSQQRRRRLH